MIKKCYALVGALMIWGATCAWAQEETAPHDTRAQYPAFLADSYFGINIGSIGYLFSGQQLEPGFRAASIDVPRLAVRIDLIGHRFTKHLSAQATYIRPVQFVAYQSINGDTEKHQVSMAYGGVTLVWDVPIGARFSVYGEGGGGVTSRSGFDIKKTTVMQQAHYTAGLLGAGFTYHATPNTDFVFGATYSPGRESFNQPSTRLFTTGIRHRMLPLPAEEVAGNERAGYAFPANILRVGFTTNVLDYGVNNFFSRTVPIFWGGNVETKQGFTLDYERNVFHMKKRFAFDLGASASYWESNGNGEIFRTLSVYPLFRFFLARTAPADLYFSYSLAGPTYLTRTFIDDRDTGELFTFQDFIALGTFVGKARRINAELGIKHYSNGNIFTRNASIKVPLTFMLGVAF